MLQSILGLAPIAILFLWNIKFSKKGEFYSDYMSVNNVQNIRGILAILIVIHHFSGMISDTTAFLVFTHIGYLVVALFLFISGYGLAYGVKNKPGYVKGAKFLYTRIPKLVIPYWIAVVLYAVGYFLANLIYQDGQTVSVKNVLLSFVSYKNIVGSSWYIFELIILYVIFFVAFKFKNQKASITSLFVAVAVCAIVFYFCDDFSNVWYRSIMAFPLGVVYSLKQDRIEAFFRKKTVLKYALTIVILIVLMGAKYICVIIEYESLQVVFDILTSAFFALVVILLLRKTKLSNKVLSFLGGISYEIYLIHFLILNLVNRYYCYGQISLLLFFVISISLVVLVACIMNYVDKYLIKLYNKIINSKK